MSTNSKAMSASLLEKLLLFIITLLFVATIGIFYALSNYAKDQANIAGRSMARTESSQKDIDSLRQSYKWLIANQEIVEKTNKIVAITKLYRYQDQVVNDIESYARQSGLRITKYGFTEDAAATAGAGAAPAATAPAASGAAPAANSAASSFKTATVQIGFGTFIPYENFIFFLKKVEQNVTRMQVTELTLTPKPEDSSAVEVTMTISVFLNKEGS